MPLTHEQQHAVDLFGTRDDLKVNAFAGAGKTSTLVAMGRSTPRRGLYLAFNKSIAEEAKTKFTANVQCRTTHSYAFQAVRQHYPNEGKLNGKLQGNFLARELALGSIAVGRSLTLDPRALGYLIARTVERYCGSGDDEVGPAHVPFTGRLVYLSEAELHDLRDYVSRYAAHVWGRMRAPSDAMPLGFDGFLKVWSLSRPRLPFDFALLDEAQDTNGAVLAALADQDCQLVYVGDRHQQIYEWRGATNAMDKAQASQEAKLTQSFRFGRTIADVATRILKALEERSPVIGNPAVTSMLNVGAADCRIARTRVGLLGAVLQTLNARRVPFVVGGTGELKALLQDVTRLKGGAPAQGADLFGFRDWADVVAFTESEEGESLRTFVKIVSTYGEGPLLAAIEQVTATAEGSDVTLTTAHKSKGLEWDGVELDADFARTKPDGKLVELAPGEETRLLYVAVTRARKRLLLPSPVMTMIGLQGPGRPTPTDDLPAAGRLVAAEPRRPSPWDVAAPPIPVAPTRIRSV